MPSATDVPGYWDDDGDFWVYGASNPAEAEALLETGEYGLEVGTVNGDDYAEIAPVGELDDYDEPDHWEDPEAYEDWLFGDPSSQ